MPIAGSAWPRYRVVALGPPQAGLGLNNQGDTVGQQTLDKDVGVRAVLLRNGSVVELGTLGGSFSTARGINNRGFVVGGSLTGGDEAHHGFLYADGRMVDLNSLLIRADGWEVLHAFAINDRLDIVGHASGPRGDQTILLIAIAS